jgi:hypothetical protein
MQQFVKKKKQKENSCGADQTLYRKCGISTRNTANKLSIVIKK